MNTIFLYIPVLLITIIAIAVSCQVTLVTLDSYTPNSMRFKYQCKITAFVIAMAFIVEVIIYFLDGLK